uniref:Epsin 3 n=1 Tax=Serinus canaria TaxID=9135 RepID=A0A8C9NJG2_SERCA
MTTSALRRQVKNIVHNYSEAEIKVREATSNDPWGPPSSLMSEIADLTFNTVAFAEVMGMIWRRLNDSGKNWRHVYKALTLLDYLIKTGSEKVTHQCRENLYTIQTLKDFQYVDRDGKDQGINIREKVKQVMALLKDEERLKQERAHALQTKERMALEGMGSGSHQVTYGRRASPYGEDYSRTRGSPSSFNSSSSSPRFASDLEQARPQTTGEEELQLQLALAMSREEAEKVEWPCLSWGMRHLPYLALSVNTVGQFPGKRQDFGADPWVPVPDPGGEPLSQASASSQQTPAGPWDFPPSTTAASDPWGKAPMSSGFPPADPWGTSAPQLRKQPKSLYVPMSLPLLSPMVAWGDTLAGRAVGSAPLCHAVTWGEMRCQPPCAVTRRMLSPLVSPSWLMCFISSLSMSEPDPFGDLFPSTRQDGAKSFDLANLADSLPESSKDRKDCKTPEAFLGPAASSLVNLDSLVAPTFSHPDTSPAFPDVLPISLFIPLYAP